MYGFIDCYYNGNLKFSRYFGNSYQRKRLMELTSNMVGVVNKNKITFVVKPLLSLRMLKKYK